jgi:flagellar basal-body rod protein FlgC
VELYDTTQLALEKAIEGSSARQQAIAANLANVDTPGYQRVDVDFHSTLRDAMASGSDGLAGAAFTPQRDATAQARPDGSSVDADGGCRPGAQRPGVRGARPDLQGPHRHPRVRDGHPLMGLFDALDASGSALSAERLRMDVTAENLANAQSTRSADGTGPYKRKQVVLEQAGSSFADSLQAARGVRVAGIVEDPSPARRVYDPGHPDADAQGYVTMPNVNTVTEMTDLIGASRAYEANVTAMQTAKSMFARTLDLLK